MANLLFAAGALDHQHPSEPELAVAVHPGTDVTFLLSRRPDDDWEVLWCSGGGSGLVCKGGQSTPVEEALEDFPEEGADWGAKGVAAEAAAAPRHHDAAEEWELRVDPSDGKSYALWSFLEEYGAEEGRRRWDAAAPDHSEPDFDDWTAAMKKADRAASRALRRSEYQPLWRPDRLGSNPRDFRAKLKRGMRTERDHTRAACDFRQHTRRPDVDPLGTGPARELREDLLSRNGGDLEKYLAAEGEYLEPAQAADDVVQRYRRCLEKEGLQQSLAFHGTAEPNVASILRRGLMLPGREDHPVGIAHGNAYGPGIYAAAGTQGVHLSRGYVRGDGMLVCGVADMSQQGRAGEDRGGVLRVGGAYVAFQEDALCPLFRLRTEVDRSVRVMHTDQGTAFAPPPIEQYRPAVKTMRRVHHKRLTQERKTLRARAAAARPRTPPRTQEGTG